LLSPEIIALLRTKTGKQEGTIRKDISLLRRKYGKLPINAVAQLYALQNRTSVLTKLNMTERESLPNIDIEKPARVVQKEPRRTKKKVLEFVLYETEDPFVKAHITATNQAYTYGCFTAAFILCRKILENLLTDIVRRKYPQNKKENIELYFDTARGRTRDFSEILANLRKRSVDFGPDKGLVERILNRADQFKDDANDKVHSWYHIVKSGNELDDTHFQDIIDMITRLEKGRT
jgi:hypothetical protein